MKELIIVIGGMEYLFSQDQIEEMYFVLSAFLGNKEKETLILHFEPHFNPGENHDES